MRWIKRIAVLIVALVVIAVAALFLMPTDRIARIATQQFEQATGRALTIAGDTRPTLFPSLGVRLENVTLANASWSDQGPMITAESVDVSVGLSALLGGAVSVERLELVRPVVLLERGADGAANWEMSPSTAPAEVSTPQTPVEEGASAGGGRGLPDIAIAEARIVDGSVTFVDRAADVQHRVTALDLTLSLPSLLGTAEVTGSGLYNGAEVTFDMAVTAPGELLDGGLSPVKMRVALGGTEASLTGRFGLSPLGFDGQIEAESGAREDLFAALGQTPPELPAGLGRDRVSLVSGVTLAPEGTLHLRDMDLKLDGNTLRGDIDILPGADRPKIVATLDSPGLDLSGLTGSGGAAASGGGGAPAGGGGWSTEPIDVSALGLVDAEIALTSGAINLGDATLDGIAAQVALEASRAVVTLAPVRAYGGTITGDVIVNGRGGLSSRVNLALAGLQTQPFLTEFADFDRLLGQVDLNVNVLGVGNSMAALMNSLDGDGAISIGRGEILGLDLVGMMRNFDLSHRGPGARTIFDGIKGQFAVSNGVLSTQDLTLLAPVLQALTQGDVNIGGQTLDLLVEPRLLQSAESEGLAVPVRVTGPWSAPKFRPDLAAAAGSELNIKREAIEAGARDAVQKGLSEELEVAPEAIQDRQSLEDAAKKRIEDKVKDALGGLFGSD